MDFETVYTQYRIKFELYLYFERWSDDYNTGKHYKEHLGTIYSLPSSVGCKLYSRKLNDQFIRVGKKNYGLPLLTDEETRLYVNSYYPLQKSVFRTHKIKEELFQKTRPKFDPVRYRVSELLMMDVTHVSVRGLLFLEKEYLQLLGHRKRYISWTTDDDAVERVKANVDVFYRMLNAIHNTSLIKEELIAKVFHPDRMDKWASL